MFAAIGLALVLCQSAPVESPSAASLLAYLRGLRNEKVWNGGVGEGSPYHDPMHGNRYEPLDDLLRLRFEATRLILDEIVWLDAEAEAGTPESPWYRRTLYELLAVAKDPSSIPWLEDRLEDPRLDQEVHDLWFALWGRRLQGPRGAEIAWLAGAEEWSAFFRRTYARESDPARQHAILETLQAWFADAETLDFFRELRADPELEPHAALAVELFFYRCGEVVDAERLTRCIADLADSEEGRTLLSNYAAELRHEAFVPWLVSLLGTPVGKQVYARSRLRRIAFVREELEASSWRRWFEQHRFEVRSDWVAAYFQRMLDLRRRDPAQASKQLHDDKSWMDGDPLVLPHLAELAQYGEFHGEVRILVTWWNEPHLRSEVQRVVEALVGSQVSGVEDWARSCLADGGFRPQPEATWEDVIQIGQGL